MNTALLIDGLLREFAQLVALIVRTADHRPSLAGLPQRVFAEVDGALRAGGMRASVLADVFGLPLRTYHDHARRARGRLSPRSLPLIADLYRCIRDEGPIERWALDGRFEQAHPKIFAAVLDELVDSGLVYRTGRGPSSRFGAVADRGDASRIDAAARLVWVTVYHRHTADRRALAAMVGDDALLDAALSRLEAEGRIEPVGGGWRCADYAIPFGDRAGWPAAIYDHVRAVVGTLRAKLESGATAAASDRVGGSTYTFEVGPGHPLDDEVLALLAETRRRMEDLRAAVLAHNRTDPGRARRRVVFYFGQHLG